MPRLVDIADDRLAVRVPNAAGDASNYVLGELLTCCKFDCRRASEHAHSLALHLRPTPCADAICRRCRGTCIPNQRSFCLLNCAGLGVDLTSVSLPVHDPLDTAKPDLPPSPVLAVATSDAKLRVRTDPPPSIWGFYTTLQSLHSFVTRADNNLRARPANHGIQTFVGPAVRCLVCGACNDALTLATCSCTRCRT